MACDSCHPVRCFLSAISTASTGDTGGSWNGGGPSAAVGAGRIAVVTFEPHPLTVLRPEHAPPRLTPPELKGELLAAAGVDDLVVLPPVPEVLNLSAEAFWQILRDEVRPAHMVEGGSFTFGRGRGGNIARFASGRRARGLPSMSSTRFAWRCWILRSWRRAVR